MTFFKNAAKYYKGEPHQDRAWDLLEEKLPKYLLEEFKTAYRGSPEPSVGGVAVSKEFFGRVTGYKATLFTDIEVDDCNKLLEETGFNRSKELAAMLLANILHETGNLRWLKELASGWAYEGRADLGNTQPGDGPRFKGAGVLQLTGRHNYSRLSKALRDPRVMEGVDYVSTTYPFRSAMTWIKENGLLNVAKSQGFDAVCRRINGGWNGIDDRRKKFALCLKHL